MSQIGKAQLAYWKQEQDLGVWVGTLEPVNWIRTLAPEKYLRQKKSLQRLL